MKKINIPLLFDALLDWRQAPNHVFQQGRILCNVLNLVVLVPKEAPAAVVKFFLSSAPRGKSRGQQEYDILERLHKNKICGERFEIPVPFECGQAPDHIVMSHLGEDYRIRPSTSEILKTVGQAVGQFAATLFEKDGTLHDDLYWNNFTKAPSGKVGIIDMASVKNMRPLEIMFRTPLVQYGGLAGEIALEFSKMTGCKIDPCFVRDLCAEDRWGCRKDWLKHDPAFAATAQQRINDNLEHWIRLFKENNEPVCPQSQTALLSRKVTPFPK